MLMKAVAEGSSFQEVCSKENKGDRGMDSQRVACVDCVNDRAKGRTCRHTNFEE